MPTLEEIAHRAGVSRSTVSRVVNGHPHVDPQTRARVWQVVRDVGYRPDSVARSLVTRRTRVIAMVIPEVIPKLFSDQFFGLLLEGAAQACNTRGYQLILALFDQPRRQEELYAQIVQNGFAEGVVVASVPPDTPLLAALKRDQIPTVAVGRQPGFPYVDVDNFGGAREAVRHLLQLGHRRIATITGPLDHIHVQERLGGYRAALEEAGIAADPDLVAEGGDTEVGAMAAMRKLLRVRPQALFAQSDTMAAGALRVLRGAEVRVPQDLALVSFDDLPLASLVEPPLTTVRQPIRLLGFRAVELLLEILEGRKPSTEVVLPVELVVRGSCGALMSSDDKHEPRKQVGSVRSGLRRARPGRGNRPRG